MSQVARIFRGLIGVIAGLVLLGCAPLQMGTPPGPDPADVVGPRKIIALVPDAISVAQMRDVTGSAEYQELDITSLSGLGLTMMTYRMPDGVTPIACSSRVRNKRWTMLMQ